MTRSMELSSPVGETQTPPGHENEIDLRLLVGTLLNARWWVIGTVAAFLTCAVLYLICATPIYSTDAKIQLEKRKPLVGELDQFSALLSAQDKSSAAEIEILRSRAVVGAVVEQLNLDIIAAPRRFPIIGAAIARAHDPLDAVSGAPPGLGRFAWGGEQIAVTRLSVPVDLQDTRLTLVAGSGGAYTLLDEDNELLLKGEVGKAAVAGTDRATVDIYVAQLMARPGTHFTIRKLPVIEAITRLQKQFKVEEKVKQSGILQISLSGPNPSMNASTVNGLTNAYVRQNVERQSEEASRMLDFLNAQMPALKEEVDKTEVALKDYRSESGNPVDLSIEGQALVDRLTEIEKQVSLLNLERSELQQRFRDQHPMIISLNEKLQKLEKTRADLDSQVRRLPSSEWQSVRLLRDVKVANELYVQLLNKSQELKVSKAGSIGNVRVVDSAYMPHKRSRPNTPVILALSLILGVISGVLLVFLRQTLRRTLEDPDSLESALGIPVYAIIPHSPMQTKVASRWSENGGADRGAGILAKIKPQEAAVESLRSLRTSLQFASLDTQNKVIAIHGPTPELGKSFISANLAYLLSEIGQRVLLIDGDLRRGHLNSVCHTHREPGLSECLSGRNTLADSVQSLEPGRLDFISTGVLPPNPSELLMHSRFQALLAEAEKNYDKVIIDCPPLLNLADAIAIAKQSGTNFMVVRARYSSLADVRFAARRLQQNAVTIQGLLFNGLRPKAAGYAYSAYYGQEYRPKGA